MHLNRFKQHFIGVALALLVVFAFAQPSMAQRPSGLGLTAQIGSPSGFGFYVPTQNAYDVDVLAAWDLDEVFFINGHLLYSSYGQRGNDVRFYYGPGAYIGIRERADDDEVTLGLSGRVGVGFMLNPVEFYLQLTPRISFLDTTEGYIGGGIGIRYFF